MGCICGRERASWVNAGSVGAFHSLLSANMAEHRRTPNANPLPSLAEPQAPTAPQDPASSASGIQQPPPASRDSQGMFSSLGRELDENAPFWRVYRDEIRNHDQTVTLDEWNKTLDILLIFSGLFSAVVTTFVAATFPLLQPQNDEVSKAIHALARAINNDSTLPVPVAARPVATSSLWINGLWFTSVFIALAVAFIAILAKQWLVEYNHRMADPPTTVSDLPDSRNYTAWQRYQASKPVLPTASLSWARRRLFFFKGFDQWRVSMIVTEVLPLLLHVALFLFFAGLAVLAWTLHRRLGYGLVTLITLLFFLYARWTADPIYQDNSPTMTPLARRLRSVWIHFAHFTFALNQDLFPRLANNLAYNPWDRIRRDRWDLDTPTEEEVAEVQRVALKWFILVCGSEPATSIALQSLGSLDPASDFIPHLRVMASGMEALSSVGSKQITPTAVDVIRAIRSELVLGRGSWSSPQLGLNVTSTMVDILRSAHWPDAQLLWAALNSAGPNTLSTSAENALQTSLPSMCSFASALKLPAASHSLHSTALLLLYCDGIQPCVLPYLLLSLNPTLLRDKDIRRISSLRDGAIQQSPALGSSLCAYEAHGTECSIRCVATFICKVVSLGNEQNYCMGTRVLSHILSQDALPDDWTSLGDIVLPAWNNSEVAAHRRCLFLTQLLLGDRPGPALTVLKTPERAEILRLLVQRETASSSNHFVIRPEVWVKLLAYILASADMASFTLADFAYVLAAVSLLKRRQQLDHASLVLTNLRLNVLLQSIPITELSKSTDAAHFMKHFIEIEPEWRTRLGHLHNDPAIAHQLTWPTVEEISHYGVCATCLGSYTASGPPNPEINLPAFNYPAPEPIHVIKLLLEEETRTHDQSFALPPEIWVQLLTEVAKAITRDEEFLSKLTVVLTGICMLRRRNASYQDALVPIISRMDEWTMATPDRIAGTEEILHFLRHAMELDPLWTETRFSAEFVELTRSGPMCQSGSCPGTPPDAWPLLPTQSSQ